MERDVVLVFADVDVGRVVELDVVASVPESCVDVECAVVGGGGGGKVLFRWMNDDSVLGGRMVWD